MKIIIADDEYMVRLGLVSMLEELYGGSDRLFQAKNGRELVELARLETPDIAFIDIKMPVMDGIEALKRLRDISPRTQCVILTCYAEFSYAQSAVSLGAADYLLKPASLDALAKCVGRIRQAARDAWRQGNTLLSMVMFNRFGAYPNDPGFADEAGFKPPFSLTLIYPDADRQTSAGLIDSLTEDLEELREGHFAVCYPFPDAVAFVTEDASGAVSRRMLDFWSALSKERVSAFTATEDSLRGIVRAAYEIDRRAVLRFAVRRAVSSLTELPEDDELQCFCRCIYEASRALAQSNGFMFGEWMSRLEGMNTDSAWRRLDANALRERFPVIARADTADEVIRELRRAGDAIFIAGGQKNDLADAVKAYIDDNYSLDIGTAVIAQTFGVSPNYLSSVFSKAVGKRLTVYLTDVRMRRARRLLLENPDRPVHEIAARVGYGNPGYFSKVFQKAFGRLPSEYCALGAEDSNESHEHKPDNN